MKWMNLKDILLSEISQSHKDIVLVHLEEVHRAVKFIETESRMRLPGAEVEGGIQKLINRYRVSVLQDKKKSSGDG